MVNEKHIERVLKKAARLEMIYGRLLFQPVCEVEMVALEEVSSPEASMTFRPFEIKTLLIYY